MARVLAERLGYDSVWTAEAYGSDALTVATQQDEAIELMATLAGCR